MKKKILFVIDSLNCGGAEKSLVSLLNLLDYSKYDVDLFMYSRGGLFEKMLPNEVNVLEKIPFQNKIDNSIFKNFTELNLKFIISKLLFSLRVRVLKNIHGAELFWKSFNKCVDDLDGYYDVAIAYNQGFATYFVANKVKAKKKLAWVNINYKLAGYNEKFDIKSYEKFDNIIAVSDTVKNSLCDCFASLSSRIKVIYDINNSELIKKLSLEECDYFKRENVIRIVTVGRLVHQKGYNIAVEAAKILKQNDINFEWLVLGEGAERKNIEIVIDELGVQNEFVLLGAKENPYPYIKSADIYVQTSKFEGFGLAIAEARMLNVPVVTTNFDCVYDQMVQEKNGLVVDMDARSVANGIMRLINDKELYSNVKSYLEFEKKGNEEEILKFYELL